MRDVEITDRLVGPSRDASGLRVTYAGTSRLALRVIAFWFGMLSLINTLGALVHSGFDANIWWIDPSFLPRPPGAVVVATSGALLIAYAGRPPTSEIRRWTTVVATGSLAAFALFDTLTYYTAWVGGRIAPRSPIPLSFVVALLLAFIVGSLFGSSVPLQRRTHRLIIVASVSLLFMVVMPLAQITFLGTTDYRRAAGAIVVLGAKVESTGQASIELANRVATATELYQAGLAPTIVMSGGIEPSGQNEAQVMGSLAEREGVPAEAIVLDQSGINTAATVADTTRLFGRLQVHRILVVSQFYHLPRVKLAYERAGLQALTVPAHETFIHQTPFLVLREVPAFWLYYLRAELP